jgi:hypothetical protein
MIVKCVRLLEGGRRSGRDVSDGGESQTVKLGHEYVVLGIHAQADEGVTYAILREDVYPALAPAALTSEMFEVVKPTIPSSWTVFDPYGDGRVVDLLPRAWTDPPDFFERKVAGDGSLIPIFVREVERMYAEEGLDPPQPRRKN